MIKREQVTTVKEPQVLAEVTASDAEQLAGLLGLDGFRVLAHGEVAGELEVLVETTTTLVGCPACGAVAKPKDRRPVWVRDLPAADRAVELCWWKRVWECPQPACEKKTWTESHEAIAPRACLTERARQWAFEQVGSHDAAVSTTARALGVAWWTVMTQVLDRGTPLIDDPARIAPNTPEPTKQATDEQAPATTDDVAEAAAQTGDADPAGGDPAGDTVTAVGVDETAFLRATGTHPTLFATGVTDLTPGRPARLLDVVQGRSGRVLGDWLAAQDPAWRAGIDTASLDPFRGYATALAAWLPAATQVLDAFHIVKLGLGAVDDVRRRVQQEQTGHRGRAGDPLYRIRRVLRRRHDRLSEPAYDRVKTGLAAGDPNGEVALAWVIAQDLMDLYQASDLAQARDRADQLITGLRGCPLPELARLGRTLRAWRNELLAHFTHPTVSNGPTENLNLKIKNTKRIARGYRNFRHYRLRLLLNHGRNGEDHRTTQIRARRPSLAA